MRILILSILIFCSSLGFAHSNSNDELDNLISNASPSGSPVPDSNANLTEFRDEIERDFPLRSIGQLEITNMRGNIQLQGWALDKIRVKAHRKVMAKDDQESRSLLSAVDFRFKAGSDGNVELSAEYGRGLNIEERIRERDHPRTSMEIQVFAPANIKLSAWAVNGSILVKNWNAKVEARTAAGPIVIENVKSDAVSILCSDCPIDIKSVRASVHAIGGSGKVELADVIGSKIYAETNSGALKSTNVRGEQLYVSKTGSVAAKDLNGHIEFYTQQGAVEMRDTRGFLSGRTDAGDITATMKDWTFNDKALIESIRGSVSVTLPALFSGDVDLWSVSGKLSVDFNVQKHGEDKTFGPEPANHLIGTIGDGGELLKIFSEKGDVHLLRGT